MAEFSEDEKRLLGETIAEMARSITSHKAALARLATNDGKGALTIGTTPLTDHDCLEVSDCWLLGQDTVSGQ
jgi:hypothetical protein